MIKEVEIDGVKVSVDTDNLDDERILEWASEIEGGKLLHFNKLIDVVIGPEQVAMLREKLGKTASDGERVLALSMKDRIFKAIFVNEDSELKN